MNNVQLKPVQEVASKNSFSFAPFPGFHVHMEEFLFKLIPLFLFFGTDFWCWLQREANPRLFGACFSRLGYCPNGEHMDLDFVSVLLLEKPRHRIFHAQSNGEADLWLEWHK